MWLKRRGRERTVNVNVEGKPMVIGMFDVINSLCGKIEVEQEGEHGKPIIELVQAQTPYQTARSCAGIATPEFNFFL